MSVRSSRSGHPLPLRGGEELSWGLFNVVEGIVDHLLLGIHHVNETAPREQWIWWDIAFLLWGAAMIVGGWRLWHDSGASGGSRGIEPSRQ
jgi:uncharacterized membrane protein